MSTAAARARANQRAELAITLLDPSLADGGTRQEAARRLFSSLAWLERLAVETALRGEGIAGQLEDELFHQTLFAEAARRLGGLAPETPELADLVGFLLDLSGAESLAVLNLVSEGWLDTVFRHLMAGGFCTEMLRSVEADEARHTEAAYGVTAEAYNGRPTSDSVLRDLEALIFRFAGTPEWLAPLAFLIGPAAAARMGIDAARRHEQACRHLGVEPDVRDLIVAARGALLSRPADPIEMNAHEQSKMTVANGVEARIAESRWVLAPALDTRRNEALVVQACSAALDHFPRLNRTIRASRLFRPADPWIGARRVHSRETRGLMTVYTRSPHRRSPLAVERELSRRAARARASEQEPIRVARDLEAMFPAPTAAVVVSNCEPYGLRKPEAWLVPFEGVSASVAMGRREGGRVHLHVTCDHRSWDADEMGAFVAAVEGFMEAAS